MFLTSVFGNLFPFGGRVAIQCGYDPLEAESVQSPGFVMPHYYLIK